MNPSERAEQLMRQSQMTNAQIRGHLGRVNPGAFGGDNLAVGPQSAAATQELVESIRGAREQSIAELGGQAGRLDAAGNIPQVTQINIADPSAQHVGGTFGGSLLMDGLAAGGAQVKRFVISGGDPLA